jgi:H/ACA ribonucleoprotein complex subunit 3
MQAKIFECKKCKEYTLKKNCPKCNTPTVNPKPAKYSTIDKFGKYRRLAKKNIQ